MEVGDTGKQATATNTSNVLSEMVALASTSIIRTVVDGDQLHIEPAGSVTPEMAAFIRANKPAIMAALARVADMASPS